jgi:hypothetical protein
MIAGLALSSLAQAGAGSNEAMRSAAATWAESQAGYHERGQTNCGTRINRWTHAMGLKPCPRWCGAFVHQAFLRAGVRLSSRMIDPDRTYDDIVAGRRGLRRIAITSVRRGDILLFAFRPRLKASHMAIVRSRPRGGRVQTVEGNVAHAVRLKVRGLQYPVLAARVVGR